MKASGPSFARVESTQPFISRRAMLVLAMATVLIIAGFGWLIVWALGARSTSGTPSSAPFGAYESAWSSAMEKAGVEATFPQAPVDVSDLVASGRHSFEATFTAEEVSALLNVYRFETEMRGSAVSVTNAKVSFPSHGVAFLKATLHVDRSRYRLEGSAPFAYDGGAITSSGFTDLEAAGFKVGESRRRQAGELVVEYLNLYLSAAPRLGIDRARIAADALVVRGWAPHRLEDR